MRKTVLKVKILNVAFSLMVQKEAQSKLKGLRQIPKALSFIGLFLWKIANKMFSSEFLLISKSDEPMSLAIVVLYPAFVVGFRFLSVNN